MTVPEGCSSALVYELHDDQVTEEDDATPVAYVYRNDEGLVVSPEPLADESYSTAKESLTRLEIVLGSSLGAAAGAAGAILAIAALTGYAVYIGLWAPYDCTTWFRRWINGCA